MIFFQINSVRESGNVDWVLSEPKLTLKVKFGSQNLTLFQGSKNPSKMVHFFWRVNFTFPSQKSLIQLNSSQNVQDSKWMDKLHPPDPKRFFSMMFFSKKSQFIIPHKGSSRRVSVQHKFDCVTFSTIETYYTELCFSKIKNWGQLSIR